MVECGGLEIRCTARYRGFESLSLRNKGCESASYAIYTLFYTQELSYRSKRNVSVVVKM